MSQQYTAILEVRRKSVADITATFDRVDALAEKAMEILGYEANDAEAYRTVYDYLTATEVNEETATERLYQQLINNKLRAFRRAKAASKARRQADGA